MDLFYQKYRPKTIGELDSVQARERLKRILSQDNLPHAFLFSGPKGTGKTSAARILAKSLNCLKSKDGDPCGKCDSCLEIQRGESLDVIEMDAASNRGIEDVRSIKEKINLQPIKSKNKVYIVDEVHMMSKDAFNAFLKTLEEPPAHVYFIFCTTNPEKIPPTIMSRLTSIDFLEATLEEITAALNRVASGEKLKIDESVLASIASVADGSFRDAHKLLYQLWLELGNKINGKEAGKYLRRWGEKKPEVFLELIAKKDSQKALALIEDIAEYGIDFSDYCKQLLIVLKNIIIFSFVKEAGVKRDSSKLKKLEGFSVENATYFSRLLIDTLEMQRTAVLPQLPLELAVITYLENASKNVNNDDASPKDPAGNEPDRPEKPVDIGIRAGKTHVLKTSPKDGRGEAKDSQSDSAGIIEDEKVLTQDIEAILGGWSHLIEVIKPMNHSVGALLHACRPKSLSDGCLVLEVYYPFHKDRLAEVKNTEIVQAGIKTVFKASWKIKFVLGTKPIVSQKPELASSFQGRPFPKGSGLVKEDSPFTSGNPVGQASGQDQDLYEIAKEIFGE